MKKIKALMIGAGSRGTFAYSPYAEKYPEKIEFTGVAEPDPVRRERFCSLHPGAWAHAARDWRELLTQGKEADVVFVCTQDRMHFEPAMAALEAGYHLVLEKPVSPSEEECRNIIELAAEKDRQVFVCYVLRYTPFFMKIKEILNSGEIGKLLSITHNENVGYYHAAHSYVRGNWRDADGSCPMILAKSCHDLDILLWLTGSHCKSISSVGELSYFTEENAPEGAPQYCQDGCPQEETCPYNAVRIYSSDEAVPWLRAIVFPGEEEGGPRLYDREADLKILKNGPYGRCVFQCDNNVVDHQAVVMEFENGVTASFHMNSCTYEISRTIRISGSLGEVTGDMEKGRIEILRFGRPAEIIQINLDEETMYGHGGGDFGIMEHITDTLGAAVQANSEADYIMESHLMCFAAEKSRITGKTIKLQGSI